MQQYPVALCYPDALSMRTPIKAKERMICSAAPILAPVLAAALAIGVGFLVPNAAAQSDPYPKRAPVDQYLMEKNAEVQLARSAAPDSISRDATILVLGRQGYETAVDGRNGFVCMVGRAWAGMFDWPEFWNPKVRAADCLNPQAARSIVPILELRARMVMAGRSKAEMVLAVQAAFAKKQLPSLESGAMDYMMSKSSYLTDQGSHDLPHVMFYTSVENADDWGSGAAGSPIMSAPYWFISPKDPSQLKGLPPILVFLVMVPDWSDGTPAGQPHD
ncbi:MAG: hypothetical protein WA294_05735 [Acidobacteriaceae bacterium]